MFDAGAQKRNEKRKWEEQMTKKDKNTGKRGHLFFIGIEVLDCWNLPAGSSCEVGASDGFIASVTYPLDLS